MGRSMLVVLVLGAAAGCGGASTEVARSVAPETSIADVPSGALGLVPGETMTFEVRVGGVLAGEAALAVGQPGVVDGRRSVAVRSRMASAGAFALIKNVVDEATTVFDMDSTLPVSMTADVVYGDKAYHADVLFRGSQVDLSYTRGSSDHRVKQSLDFGSGIAHDAHSAMAAIRTWQPEPGATRSLWVMGGRRAWRSDVRYVGRETLGTSFGNHQALRIDGTAYRVRSDRSLDTAKGARTFTVWMSDDADRVPLRVVATTELGDVTIDLTDYRRP